MNNGHASLMIIVAIAIVVSYFAIYQHEARLPADATTACATDSDCVPTQCCHPDAAVNRQFAPDCKGTFCSQECRPGTLDCGNGEIKCVNKVCKVVLK